MSEAQSDRHQLSQMAQKLWEQGRREDAIRHLIELINQTPKQLPRVPCLQLAFYLFQGNQFRSAETVLSEYLKQHPQDYEALENRGIMRSRMGNVAAAHADFQQVVTHCPESVNAWDALTATLYRLGRLEEARKAGAKVLTIKDQQCQSAKAVQVTWPTLTPSQWDAQHPTQQDVIAFSLWGSHPIYLRGAVRNLLEAPRLYPGWVCRFYMDHSVPEDFPRLVKDLGGQVVTELPGQSQRQKLGWRFQVANDPTVRRFLVRDADSVICEREVHAVQAWLDGMGSSPGEPCWFHVMRDWWTHTDLILAGMWGGRAGLMDPLLPKLRHYQSGRLETANIDQWFLRDCVWGAIRPHCLIHDRCFEALGAKAWPDPPPPGNFHVGQNEAAVRATQQTEYLAKYVQKYQWLQLSKP